MSNDGLSRAWAAYAAREQMPLSMFLTAEPLPVLDHALIVKNRDHCKDERPAIPRAPRRVRRDRRRRA